MGKVRLDPLRSVNFHCKGCGHRFAAEPQVEDAPEDEHHPFRYWQECTECRARADQVHWERNLMKAHANATGPKSPEGKAASAANLEGHPTPEEAQRTRFNAMKHGLYADVATYFPAKPGHYPACDGCEHRATMACLDGMRACLKRTELFLKHQIAFDTQDPKLLTRLRANTQAGIQALIDDMLLAIAQDGGPRIHEIQWYHDKEGEFHLAGWYDDNGEFQQIHEVKAHPLLKILMEFISKNSMTLADMGMTPKVQDDQDLMQGYLDQQNTGQEPAEQFQQRLEDKTDKLMQLVNNSYKQTTGDVIEGEVEVVGEAS